VKAESFSALDSILLAAADAEFAGHRPERPRLIPEVPLFQVDGERLLAAGFGDTSMLCGPGVVSMMRTLAPLLDGHRTTGEILEHFAGRRDEADRLLQVLIGSGLIEEGAGSGFEQADEALSGFIARNLAKSGWHRSRDEVAERLQGLKLWLYGSDEFIRQMGTALSGLGIGEISADSGFAGEANIILCQHRSLAALALTAKPLDPATRIFGAEIDGGWCAVGPTLDLSAAARAGQVLARWRSGLPAAAGIAPAELFADSVAQHFFNYLARLTDTLYHRRLTRMIWSGGGFEVEHFGVGDVAVHPVEGFSPREHRIAGRSDFDRLLALTEMPVKEELPPSMHRAHYVGSNLALTQHFPPPLNAGRTVALPPPSTWEPGAAGQDRESFLPLLSSLLHLSGGLYESGGHRRRVVPSGGNIGAVELFLACYDAAVLDPGLYRYCAVEHRLERVRAFAAEEAATLAGDWEKPPQAEILYCGNINRIEGKYSSFAFQLIQYEAGTMLHYLRAAAAAHGAAAADWPLGVHDALAQMVPLPRITGSFAPYASCGLSFGERPAEPISRHRARAAARRACRRYAIQPVDPALPERMLRTAAETERALREPNGLSVDFLLVSDGSCGLASGIYRPEGEGLEMWVALPAGTQEALFNQSELGRSPFKLISLFRPDQLGEGGDHRRFPALLRRIASAMAAVWLELGDAGLGGTAAGGALRQELLRRLPKEEADAVPLLSLCFGPLAAEIPPEEGR
jgi:SagB-type dehydrogenase family enzyme